MGGGACWSAATCALTSPTFSEDTSFIAALFDTVPPTRSGSPGAVGISDRIRDSGIADPAAPEYDWTHVYIPYCTGDLHWGNASVTYMPGVTIHHNGAVNAQAAITWTLSNLPSPTAALVTGCSAGGYGSLFWAAKIAATYVVRATKRALPHCPVLGSNRPRPVQSAAASLPRRRGDRAAYPARVRC